MRHAELALLAFLVGCGGTRPAVPTASTVTLGPTCQPQFGSSFVVNNFGFLGAGQGFDLNGDGTVDNELSAIAGVYNPQLVQRVTSGSLIYLFDVSGLPAGRLVDGTPLKIAFYNGVDVDSPVDPSNNLTGSGQFLVPREQLDVSCNSTSLFDKVVVSGGEIEASAAHLFNVTEAYGDADWLNVHLQVHLAPDGKSLVIDKFGWIWSACDLSHQASLNDSRLLDSLVGLANLQPDMDVDGDGLERFVTDGGRVVECIDGDGTVIEGPSCACDPRIVDGYSLAVAGTTISAHIVGATAP